VDHSLERLDLSSEPMQPISVTYACVECSVLTYRAKQIAIQC